MNPQFILWGGTGQARVLHEAVVGNGFEVVLIVDNKEIVSPLPHVPIVTGRTGLENWLQNRAGSSLFGLAAIGGAQGEARLEIMDVFRETHIQIATLVHKNAFVALDASIQEGSQILAQSAVCTHVNMGRGVIVNTAASVDHDCRVGDGVHIGPGAKIAGEVTIGRCAFIGTGAVVLPGLCIGEHATIGAGAVVTKNVPAGVVVVGNPAKPFCGRQGSLYV